MSSRFVSSGAIDAISGDSVPEAEVTKASTSSTATRHQAEWERVERELQDERRKRAAAKQAAGTGETSLYEALQANKAAKQAEFEEAHKLKNQFRPLDEDEVDFLDSLLASSREAEERVRRETQSGLDEFRAAREQQQAGDAPVDALVVTGLADDDSWGPEGWQVSGGGQRKRKRRRDDKAVFVGVKRKSSGVQEKEAATATASSERSEERKSEEGKGEATRERDEDKKRGETNYKEKNNGEKSEEQQLQAKAKAKAKPVLVDYGSDGSNSD